MPDTLAPLFIPLLLFVCVPPAVVVLGFANFDKLPQWARIGVGLLALVIVIAWLVVLSRL